MNHSTLSDAEKISLLRDSTIALSVSQAQFITQQLIQDMKRFKLNLLVMKINRGFETLGYKDFKSYVLAELTLSYDAVIKQMIAANAAIKLFGPDKVGLYSDSSMITLHSLSFELQIKVIIALKAKFNKHIEEDLSHKELTKKNVYEALKTINKKALKHAHDSLTIEYQDDGFSEYAYDLSDEVFQFLDEEEFKAKHGFSRWDARTLTLLSSDKLSGWDPDELSEMLTLEWTMREMLNHIHMFYPDSYAYAKSVAGHSGHNGLVGFLAGLYKPNDETDHEPDDIDTEEDDDDFEHSKILDCVFFCDAPDDSTKLQFRNMRKQMRKELFRQINQQYSSKNPKAAVLLVLAKELCADELAVASAYFSELSNIAKHEYGSETNVQGKYLNEHRADLDDEDDDDDFDDEEEDLS